MLEKKEVVKWKKRTLVNPCNNTISRKKNRGGNRHFGKLYEVNDQCERDISQPAKELIGRKKIQVIKSEKDKVNNQYEKDISQPA